MRNHRCLYILGFLITATLAPQPSRAEEVFDPFGQLEGQVQPRKKQARAQPEAARPPLAAMDNRTAPGGDADWAPIPAASSPGEPSPAIRSEPSPVERSEPSPVERSQLAPIERSELPPVLASDGSGLPSELWQGLDVPAIERLVAKLELPPRSPAVQALWRRLITASDSAAGQKLELLRADALTRSGLLEDAGALLNKDPAALSSDALRAAMAARVEIGLGHTDQGCELTKSLLGKRADLPKPMQGDAILMTGYCAAVKGNPAAAGLTAELAREEKIDQPAAIAILDMLASGQKTPITGLKTVTLLQYRTLALGGGVDRRDTIEHGEPALLLSLARDTGTEPALRLAAGEAAAKLNALTPAGLAELYRTLGAQAAAEALLTTRADKADPAAHRASLFKAAEAERTPLKKVRLIRALLDDAKRSGLYLQTLVMLSATADSIQPVPEIGWFAETGIEIGLASGKLDRARQWSLLGGSVPGDGGLRHWNALIDLADPALKSERGRALASVEELAARGRLSPDLVHRLATVLDANDINVPIPLWEAASKVPPPANGYLPDTGVLTELQDASKKKEFGRTVLLVMRALGPAGSEGAHMIGLGDSIRALRRAGLDNDARRLSFEALFAQWPRSVSN